MQAISIDVSAGHPTVEASQWRVLDPPRLVQHIPTSLIFEIYVDPEKGPDDVPAFGDFRADLVHVCEGRAPPPDGRLKALGQEAFCMCLSHIGIVALVDELPGEE